MKPSAISHQPSATASGCLATVVVSPTIRTKGMFAEGGEAEVWFSDDERRYPVQVKSKFGGFTITLALQSVTLGDQGPLQTIAAVANEP